MTTGTDSPGSAGEPAAPPFQQKPTLVRGRRRSRHASSSSSSTENTAVRVSSSTLAAVLVNVDGAAQY